MRRARRRPSDDAPPTPSLTAQHPAAAAAASCAMRFGQIPSRDPRGPYNQLDGPASFTGPQQQPQAGHYSSGENPSMGQQCSTSSAAATPHQSTLVFCRPAVVDDIGPAAAISPIQEPNGIDGRNSSVPSSFRQVHKAKSMWMRPGTGDHQPRTITRSKSFRQWNPRSTQKDQYSGRNDAALQLARSQFEGSQVERSASSSDCDNDDKGRLRSYMSTFSLRRREHKPFPKSLRQPSEGTASPSTPADRSLGRPHKHRSLSNSIKSGFKRVFGRSKHTDATAQPSPQSGSSYGVEPVVTTPSTRDVEGVPAGNSRKAPPPPRPLVRSSTMDSLCDSESRVTSSASPGDRGPSEYPRRLARSATMDSLRDSESRVTSWADSSLTNTVTSRKPEHGRLLPSIEEDGKLDKLLPPTPSRVVSGTQNQLPSVPLSNRNLEIDCQDLCSAIQQEINRNQRSRSNEAPIFGRVPERRVAPQMPASAYSQYGGGTVRHVLSQEALVSPFETNEAPIFGRIPQRRVVPEMPDSEHSQYSRRTLRRVPSQEASISPDSFATARGEQSSPRKCHLRPAKPLKLHPSESSPPRAPQEETDTLMGPRLQDATRNIDSPGLGSGIRSVNPSPSVNIVDDAIGILISRRHGQQESRSRIAQLVSYPRDSNGRVLSGDETGVRDIRNAFPVRRMEWDYSPSIYSRTSSGITLPRPDVDSVGRSHDESGMATIFTQQRMSVSPRHAPPDSTSEDFSKTSADWHRWLNSEVGKLGQTKPPREHIREYEQFQDEDEEQFQNENEEFQEEDEPLTNVARDDDVIAPGNEVISMTLTPAETSSFTPPAHVHTEQRSSTRNFSWLVWRPSSDMSEQQDLPENTMGDAHTPTSASAMHPATDSATNPGTHPDGSTSPASNDYASPTSANYASPASGDPISPSSVLRTRVHNQSVMGRESQPLQPPDTPTPKAADRKRVFAASQRNQYAVRRAAIAKHQRRQQEQAVNNENYRDQPDESTGLGVIDRYLEIRERCEQVANPKENMGTAFPNSKMMVEEFLKRPRGPQNPPNDDDDTEMGGFL
ncbi:uncharacterized protein N7515_000339 [Penicillium bovifimosum]|uniref:Uncharacterized protein n=1 Tax=Penicillium bovifimosum TaxID=126998 RepID=A0A9W9HF76_9EURO|nr:uncharacterized protein N7515_000339 [Penicillium bovifimosum]KAJ5145775.1 hypothetical protein N7515_000339 [Penicillium bovifimosum]